MVRTHITNDEEDDEYEERPRRDHNGGGAKTILTTIMVVLLIAALLFGVLYFTVLKDRFTIEPEDTTTASISAEVKVVEVPDLVGKYYSAVDGSPRYSSFTFTRVEAYSEEAAGKIIAQNISPGTKVNEGANIELTVSKGEEKITMPDVVGSTYEDASARLTALGFKVTRSDIRNDGSEVSGTVRSA
ncbi:MAG: PASTA domain-containing protein, partial [Clostridia bacterium]|nr:PASTA domain-containing protein [Clostridia bacterium]